MKRLHAISPFDGNAQRDRTAHARPVARGFGKNG